MSSTQRATVPDTTRVDDELLTMQEVADVVRVPVATLRYWRHLGTGPRSFRIGRSVRYWRTEVFAWLDDQANGDRQSVVSHHAPCRRGECLTVSTGARTSSASSLVLC